MPELPKLSPKFEGPRFGKHTIPIELLDDLIAYRDLIKDVAKGLFRKEHPERRRVPSAFEQLFRLAISDVKNGSAVAELVPDISDSDDEAEILQYAPYLTSASAIVHETIRSTETPQGGVPVDFPFHLLSKFQKIGRNLKPGEVIDFGFGTAKPAKYNQDVRQTLVLLSGKEVERDVDVIGKVVGIHNEPEDRVDVKLEDGRTVSGPYSSEHEDMFISGYKQKETHWIRIRGSGTWNRQNRLARFTNIADVDVINEDDRKLLTSLNRIHEMEKLQPGWCGPGSVPPPAGAAAWAKEIVKIVCEEHGLPAPFVFPTALGDVQLEWKFAGVSIDVRLQFVGRVAEILAYSDVGEEESSIHVPNGPSAMALANTVAAYAKTLSR